MNDLRRLALALFLDIPHHVPDHIHAAVIEATEDDASSLSSSMTVKADL